MSCKKFIAAVTLFILINLFANVAFAVKSVYIISSQDASEIKAYKIDANHVTLQGTANVYVDGAGYSQSPVACAVWPQRNLLPHLCVGILGRFNSRRNVALVDKVDINPTFYRNSTCA